MTAAGRNCSSRGAENRFGPAVGNKCNGGFDFTLLFEQSILTLGPAAIFLVAFPIRFAYLARKDARTALSRFRVVKLVSLHLLLHYSLRYTSSLFQRPAGGSFW
jgi:hypothetical protein